MSKKNTKNHKKTTKKSHKKHKKITKELKTIKKEVEGKKTPRLTQSRLRMIDETMRALVANPTKKAAAESLDISETALYKRLSKYPMIEKGVNNYLESVKNDARRKIDLRSVTSVDRVINYADNARSEQVGLQANLELLDRAGIVKPQNNTNIQVNVLNDLKKLKSEYN